MGLNGSRLENNRLPQDELLNTPSRDLAQIVSAHPDHRLQD